ncbi:MAG: sugar phosphate isomerase/epimerase [Verrucomicrobia bacterium]|nr:sugar phosphate isomerase/epimerase [Verrucomicrobiota bacterium]
MNHPHMTLSNNNISRRAMLSRSAQALVFTATAGSLAPLLAAPAARSYKIGAVDCCLGKRSDPAAFDVAKEIGLDGVQVDYGAADNMRLPQAEVQKAFREAARRTGLEIPALFVLELNGVPLKSDPRAEQWLASCIDVCKAMDVPMVMAPCFGNGELDMSKTAEIDHLVVVLKKLATQAEKQGVIIGFENYLSADDNRRILDRVGSPALKVYYDVGNSTDKGRDILKEIRTLGKLICQVHAKDGEHMLGKGRIDFKEVRKALDDIAYSGWIVIEAASPNGIVPDYTAHCKYLKDVFSNQS